MDAHIKQLCRSCFYQLRRLRVIRHCESRGSLLTLACAFICNRIDYCNSVLCGVTAGRLDHLQSVLNATARLILNIPKFSHISLAIRDELHWLPVQYRSVQNLYPRAKQHCRFFATLSTGTLPLCRLRVGSSASSICWPKPGASFQLFLGGQNFFLFLNATRLLKNWKKQHFICSNLTLFVVPFFLFSSFFLFFLFFFFLGGRRPPQPPSNDAPGRNDLLLPQFSTVNCGSRGFSISGPRLWNSLPHDIRQSVGNLNRFKNKLKMYFFQLQQRH